MGQGRRGRPLPADARPEESSLSAERDIGGPGEKRFLGRLWLWEISSVLRKVGLKDYSFRLTEVSRPWTGLLRWIPHSFVIPQWLDTEFDCTRDVDTRLGNRSLNSDLRRMRNNQLSFEITRDPEQLHEFYRRMYLPYAISAHKDQIHIRDHDELLRHFKDCELVFVKKADTIIGGMLLRVRGGEVGLWKIGILDGDRRHLIAGAVGALYYRSILRLRELGHEQVSLGCVRPFLNDGVVKYKRKWGPRFKPLVGPSFCLQFGSFSRGARGFLLGNPFLSVSRNQFRVAAFLDEPPDFDSDQWAELLDQSQLPGLTGLQLYVFEERHGAGPTTQPVARQISATVHSALRLFPRSEPSGNE